MGMFDDLIPAGQGAPATAPSQAAMFAKPADMSMFADLLPSAGNKPGVPGAVADDSGYRPLTIRPKASPQIQVDPTDAQGAAQAARTLDPANTPGPVSSGLRGAAQGMTFGFGDELKGLSAAAGSSPEAQSLPASELIGGVRMGAEALAPSVFGHGATDRYNRALSQARADDQIARDANPGSYFLGELGGGIASLPFAPELAPFKAAEGAGIVGQGASALGNMAANGAAYGAVAGAGGADGGVVDRLKGAGMGAALGGVVNPAFGSAASAVSGGVGKSAELLRANLMARNDPAALADQIVARRLGQDSADIPSVSQRLADSNLTPAADGAQGPPALTGQLTAADVAGPNTQNLAGSVLRKGGPGQADARQLVDGRQVGGDAPSSQGERINGAIDRMMGNGLARDAIDQIMTRRSAEAGPFYQAGFGKSIDYGTAAGGQLMRDLNRVPNSAKAAANRILQIEDSGGSQIIFKPNDAGEMELVAAPNPRQWDYIKRGLDNQIEAHTNEFGRVDTEGHALTGLKRDLLANLDKAVPELANARRIYAGHSEMIDAIRSGAKAFNPAKDAHEMQAEIASLHSAAEKDAYRMAAAQGLKDRLSKLVDGADKARAISKTPDIRAKVGMLAPDDTSKMRLMAFIRDERAMADTRVNQLGNSATAGRLAEEQDFAEHAEGLHKGLEKVGLAAHVTHALATGNFWTLFNVARHLSNSPMNPEMRGAVLDEVRKIILNPDPSALTRLDARLAAASVPHPQRQAVVGTLRNALRTSTTVFPRTVVQAATQSPPPDQ